MEKARHPHQSDEDAESKDALVFPPHLAPYGTCSAAEGRRLARHGVRLVHEELDALPAAEDLLHVLDHDVLHLSELRLCAGDVIGRGRGVVGIHELRDDRTKGRLQCMGWKRRRRRRGRGTGQKLRSG